MSAWRGLWLLLACTASLAEAPAVGHLEVVEGRLERDGEDRYFEAVLDIELGTEVEEALHSGVPITLAWMLELRDPDAWFGAAWAADGRWRLSYRPLSRHYSLREGDSDRLRNYPALTPLLADLARVRVPVSVEFSRPLIPRYRVRLEIGSLPPPLRLPGYLSEAWRLDSGWVEAQ